MRRVLRWLRRYWWVLAVLAVVVVVCAWLVKGAVDAGDERRASRDRIEASAEEAKDLARQVKDQNDTILHIAQAIDNATSPAAQQRSAATLAGAIADLRRSIDCAALYAAGWRTPPCADVDARMDALSAGADPFAAPAAPAPPSGAAQ